MKNKLTLICLSIMTTGFIHSSVGMFRPTATLSQSMTNVVNFLAKTVKEQLSNGTLVYKPETQNWWLNGKTQVADAYVLNALTLQEKNAAQEDFSRNFVPTSHTVSLKVVSAISNSPIPSLVVQNSNQNNSKRKPNFFANAFAALIGLLAGIDSVTETSTQEFVDENSIPVQGQQVNTQISLPSTNNTMDISNSRLDYFPHDEKVVATAVVAVVAGISYLTYKAYKNGFFSKLNPFGKTAVVEEVTTETAPVIEKVKAPVVMHKRMLNKAQTWNAKTRMYEVA